MKLSKLLRIRRSRRFPIKRDEAGLSLRARCFKLFEQGKRPVGVAGELKMEKTTVYRYFRDWKRFGPNFERRYAYVQSLFSKTAHDRDNNIELFARVCRISKEEFETILSQPHGLRRFLSGKFNFPINADVDHKRHVALELAVLISDHLITDGGNFEDVYFTIKRYLHDHQEYREDVDTDVREENKAMELIHAILEADMERERKGRIKPDTLSEEERNALMKMGIKAEMKKVEKDYWFRIGVLVATGLTKEEAREKIYQDLLEKGDIKRAKLLREFQDLVHPVKPNLRNRQQRPNNPLPPETSPEIG